EILLDSIPPESPDREPVETILAAGVSAAALHRQLLAVSRRQVVAPQDLDLNSVIESTSRMLRRLIGEDINLVTAFATDLGLVNADPRQIDQILMNLAANSRDAMPGGGTLSMSTSEVTFSERSVSQHPGAHVGTYV